MINFARAPNLWTNSMACSIFRNQQVDVEFVDKTVKVIFDVCFDPVDLLRNFQWRWLESFVLCAGTGAENETRVLVDDNKQ